MAQKSEIQGLRGGSWFSVPRWVRGAARLYVFPPYGGNYWGFRLAKDPVESNDPQPMKEWDCKINIDTF